MKVSIANHNNLDCAFEVDLRPRLPLVHCPRHEPDRHWDQAEHRGLIVRVNISCPECYSMQRNVAKDAQNRVIIARTFGRPQLEHGPQGFGLKVHHDTVKGSARRMGVVYYAAPFPGSRDTKLFWHIDPEQVGRA